MKYIKLPQPYATALCYGFYNSVHLEDAMKGDYETIPVYATEPVFDPLTPVEILMEIHNEQIFGNLPPTEELPVNAFIGYVSATKKFPKMTNVWDMSLQQPAYPISGCHVFDEPFYCGNPNVDVDVLKWGPCFVYQRMPDPSYFYGISIHASKKTYMTAITGGTIRIDLTDDVRRVILIDPEDESTIKRIEYLCIHFEKRMKYVKLSGVEIFYDLGPDGNPVMHPSLKSTDKPRLRVSALFHCLPEDCSSR